MPKYNGTLEAHLSLRTHVEFNPQTGLVYVYMTNEAGQVLKLITLTSEERRAMARWLENNDLN